MSAKERSVPQGKYARTGYTSPIDAALHSAAKAAVISLGKTLAVELAPRLLAAC